MANYWLHNGFLQVEGRKMSKREGNIVTIHDLLHTEKFGGRKWPGEVLRLAMLMTHYREPIDFSVRRLEEAYSVLVSWKENISNVGLSWQEENRDYYAGFAPSGNIIKTLADDLNFSAALSEMHSLAKSRDIRDGHLLFANLIFLGMTSFDEMQRWELSDQDYPFTFEISELDNTIRDRLAFIAAKNWSEADRIRDELLAQGIQLKDGKDPATGERVTTWEVKR
jgi:cysteinyl-tRNA synthetase